MAPTCNDHRARGRRGRCAADGAAVRHHHRYTLQRVAGRRHHPDTVDQLQRPGAKVVQGVRVRAVDVAADNVLAGADEQAVVAHMVGVAVRAHQIGDVLWSAAVGGQRCTNMQVIQTVVKSVCY